MSNTVTQQLAAFSSSVTKVSGKQLEASCRTLLDTLGVAACGAATPAGRASQLAGPGIWGLGSSPIWFSNKRLTPSGAAFVNAAFASSLDLDDGHRAAAGHPAAAIVPAVLALRESQETTGHKLLSAIAIGYEVAVRAAASRDINSLRTTDTGLWCGYGVAAATSWLMQLPEPVAAHAMAIAGQTATGQFGTGWTRLGHTVKEGIPWASASGVQSVALAAAGHRGPLDILDEVSLYDQKRLIQGLGDSWAIEQSYFKRYSCCRWAHAAIDAAVQLKERLGVSALEIDEVVVETFARALSLPNQAAPASHEAAQYSIPFCVAVALLRGTAALMPLEDGHLVDNDTLALSSRIRLAASPRYAGAFPATTPASVSISARGRSASLEIEIPKGDPGNPMSDKELGDKFLALTLRRPMSQTQSEAIAVAIRSLLDDAPTEPLFNGLCNPS